MNEDLEDQVLQFSRNGLHQELKTIIQQNPSINLNCRGKSKSNRTWTPLHLAAYFGHKVAVEVLLRNNADPNIGNCTGDTPLHKAAFTTREDVVMCLLHHNASTTIKNDEGKRASQVACDVRIKDVLEAAEKGEFLKSREFFIQAVKEGRVNDVKDMLSRNVVPVNVCDELGNTALHHAAMRDQRAMGVALLQNGADPSKTNKNGDKAADLCGSKQMRRLLDVIPLRTNFKCAKRFEGPLMKGKRFLGRRWHWVVLEKGVMSFYLHRGDAATGTRRKSFKYLTEATISIRDDNQFGFTIRYFDGSRHNLLVNQNQSPLVHRKKWVDAINEHVEHSNHFVVDDHVIIEDDDDDSEVVTLLDVNNVVQTAQAHHHALKADIEEMTPLIQQFVTFQCKNTSSEGNTLSTLVLGKCHKVLEMSSEMSQAFTDCIAALERHNQARDTQLKEERERNRVLEQALQALATEHLNLEQSITSQGNSPMPPQPGSKDKKSSNRRTSGSSRATSSAGDYQSDNDEFFDAVSGDSESSVEEMSMVEAGYDQPMLSDPIVGASDPIVGASGPIVVVSPSTSSQISQMSALTTNETPPSPNDETPSSPHRTRLPVPMFSRDEFSIWHILRQCIGKELSKITMPVIFNEPLSFIQRLCEYMEYSSLLGQACNAQSSIRRMEYVAAFAVSALASQLNRLGKPFNPLLGETFENIREDLGFHWISEQVSHHPPVSAFHAKNTHSQLPFAFHGSVYPKLKFWGKSVEVEPRGTMLLELPGHGETYTWSNPKISIHNIVVGKLWMEQHGAMEITNHKSHERCIVTFKSYSWFRNDINKIEGVIKDSSNTDVRHLVGDWTQYVYSMSPRTHDKLLGRTSGSEAANKRKPRSKSDVGAHRDDVFDALTSLSEEGDCERLWTVEERPEISSEMYNMTQFAMTLNENEVKGYDLPPTDSRLRPDIRTLEKGEIDGASEKKHNLEEKQRIARKLRHKKKQEWTPRWFAKQRNPFTNSNEWIFDERYLARDWANSPDIF